MNERKVIIVDDELPARKLIREYLLHFTQLRLLGECRNGDEAVSMINSLQPDLVFLDIQMPGMNGFEVLQQLESIPNIIFTTAYEQFALKAFEVSAIDYLLKPYTKERFVVAVEKALKNRELSAGVLEKLSESFDNKRYPERILVEKGNKLVSINVREIVWIEAEGDFTKIHLPGQIYISNKGIGEMELKLDPAQFQRIHRSAIISLNAIREVLREVSGPQVLLKNGVLLKVSRSYNEAIRKLIY